MNTDRITTVTGVVQGLCTIGGWFFPPLLAGIPVVQALAQVVQGYFTNKPS